MALWISAMTAEEPLDELSTSVGQVKGTQRLKEEFHIRSQETTADHLPPSDKSGEEDPTPTDRWQQHTCALHLLSSEVFTPFLQHQIDVFYFKDICNCTGIGSRWIHSTIFSIFGNCLSSVFVGFSFTSGLRWIN